MTRGIARQWIPAWFLFTVAACGVAAPPTATTIPRPGSDEILTTSTTTMVTTTTPIPASNTATEPQPTDFLMEQPLPEGAFLEDASHDGETMVASVWMEGSGQHLLSWTGDGWDDADLALYGMGDFFAITELLHFDGNFYAFVMGDDSVGRDTPSFLVSHDGRTWARQELLVSLAYTPESPPYPGQSAVSDALVAQDRLIVTGWVTDLDGGTLAAVWQSEDGHNWNLSTLDVPDFPNEWGATVAVNGTDMLLRVGGPFHGGLGTWYSSDFETWDQLDTNDVSLGNLAASDALFVASGFDIVSGREFFAWSSDGEDWTTSPPPISEISYIHALPDGRFLLASWSDQTVVGTPGGEWTQAFPFRVVTIENGTALGMDGENLVSVELPE